MERFALLLQELGAQLGITLQPDHHGACCLVIDDELRIQLQPDGKQEHLLVASLLCEIPPGKFRENILKDALKANAPFPIYGTLSYHERNNQLALFARLPLPECNGARLTEFLKGFIEKAKQWRQGVKQGTTASCIGI